MDKSIFFILLIAIPIISFFIAYKLWKWNLFGKLLSLMIILFYVAIICDIGCNMCGLEYEQAHGNVIKQLKKKGLDIRNLKFTNSTGSCAYHFIYTDNNTTIDYTIHSTWIHGVKTSWYVQPKP